MSLNECRKHIGLSVTYHPFDGCSSSDTEHGVITSCNDSFAFVRYGSDINSKATRPEDLTLG